jgi:hypothetical protein
VSFDLCVYGTEAIPAELCMRVTPGDGWAPERERAEQIPDGL